MSSIPNFGRETGEEENGLGFIKVNSDRRHGERVMGFIQPKVFFFFFFKPKFITI